MRLTHYVHEVASVAVAQLKCVSPMPSAVTFPCLDIIRLPMTCTKRCVADALAGVTGHAVCVLWVLLCVLC